jgi:hypothetical protein
MSIAVEESHNLINETTMANFHHSDNQVSFWDSLLMSQGAYVAGRTAEPTEAEIEAAARVFFGNLHYPSASLDWDKASDQVKDNWRLKTRLALTAARKAVTGDE